MKKLLYVILAIIALLIAAVFLTPQFIDANKYKSEAEAQFKAATGYDMAIKGEVKLSFFPKIQARIKNVSIFNGLKNLANIDEITAYPRAKTLFKDKIVINSLKADKVTVTLEKNEAGNNWEVSSTPAAIPVSKLDLQVTSVDIVDGKVDYADSVKKEAYSFSDLNFKTGITVLTVG